MSESIEETEVQDEIISLGQHPVDTTEETFESLGLSGDVLKTITHIGFKNPTPIQAKVIPDALKGSDILGLAQTGSGKTAAFCLPLAEKLIHGQGIRGLILCPTREIAQQTKVFLDIFGKHNNLKATLIIGGMRMNKQIEELKAGPDIIVATPGRLLDHAKRKNVSLKNIEQLVLDEADHMFDLGFLPQIRELLRLIPDKRRTMMFSATMPFEIEELSGKYLTNPIKVDIMPKGTASGISHRLYMVDFSRKHDCLLALLHSDLGRTLVFTRTKKDADWLHTVLTREGQPSVPMHSDRSQKERMEALESFRQGTTRVLIATDIASRGIDVPGIEHVINFDIPATIEEYVHRSGRTARAGATGLVSTISTWQDKGMIAQIEKKIDKELPRCAAPGVEPYEDLKIKSSRSKSRRGRR